jgi:CheY-like chemotaxis protein
VGTADISTRKESEPLLADAAKGVNVRDEVILLGEDNADMAELLVRVLGSSGFTNEVVIVRDGVETLDYLFGQGEHAGRDPTDTPGLIVSDLNMPRMRAGNAPASALLRGDQALAGSGYVRQR